MSSNGTSRNNGSLSRSNGALRVPAVNSVNCVACQDSLWIALEQSEPGQPSSVVPCACQTESSSQVNQLRTYANLGVFVNRTFENLSPRGRQGRVDPISFQSVVDDAKRFAEEPTGWLTIAGPVASGKSHLAAAIANHITSGGQPAKFISALHIEDMLREEVFGDGSDSDGQMWDAVSSAPVLVIDDFGAHYATDWLESRIDQLLTDRAAASAPTVIVLAKPLDQISERNRARLSDTDLCTQLAITPGAATSNADDAVPKLMLERMTFDSFEVSGAPTTNRTEQDTLSVAFAAAKYYASNPEKWLYLHGPTGVGKTHLAVAIAGLTTAAGWSPCYWRVPDLLDRLRQTFAAGSETSFYDVFSSVKNAELLILDDFVPLGMTEWTLEKLYQLVCHRYDLQLPTVITSQYIIWEGFEDSRWQAMKGRVLWDSIRSRLADTSVVTERLMSAPDYRNRGA